MNPALLNYLQQRQDAGGGVNAMEHLGDASMPNQTDGNSNNPFDSGIRRAIETARESLGMTEKQQDKALRRGLLNFAANISQTPKQKGFFANFGAGARAAIPAMLEYDNAESAYEGQNNALANQILQHQNAQEAQEWQKEKFAAQQAFKREQLSELQKQHALDNEYKQAKLANEQQGSISPLGSNFAPIESKSERAGYSKLKQSTGEVLGDLKEIEKQFNELQNMTEDDLINPMNPYLGSYANKAKDMFTYFAKDSSDLGKSERKKSIKRKAFEAEVNKFQVEFERKLKGGVLGKGIIEIFDKKKMLPSVGDAPDVFAQKMQDLEKMIKLRYQAADNSLRYNTHISPYDMEKLGIGDTGDAGDDSGISADGHIASNGLHDQGKQNVVLMHDGNGKYYHIPQSDVQSALNDPNEPLMLVGS